MTAVTIDLSEDLLRRARDAGLLSEEAIQGLLEDAMRRRSGTSSPREALERQWTLDAMADVDAGRLLDDDAVQAWVDSLDSDSKIPVPRIA